MPIQEYFSSSYAEARPKFVDAARNGQAELVSYRLPGYSGPGGEDLAVDVARLRSANARNLFLIISGTHGVEGFAGSGCQVGFFNDQLYEALPPYTGAILIHALNPFGFARLRRVNEDNVDLNRNFQDFTKPLPLSRDYDLCHKMLVPDDWDGPKRKEADAALSKYIADNGPRVLQAAISGGQYSHSDGLFYGGIQKSWSHRTFHQILIDHVSSDIENIAVLDLHTGLGPTGYGEPIYLATSGETFDLAKSWYGPSVTSPAKGDSVSANVTGTVADALRMALPNAQTIYIALEYGTVAVMEVLTALRADNWLHAVADQQSPLAQSIKAQIRAALYVDTSYWKAAVFGRFADFVVRASRGLATCNSKKVGL
jgi:hypothetical protein